MSRRLSAPARRASPSPISVVRNTGRNCLRLAFSRLLPKLTPRLRSDSCPDRRCFGQFKSPTTALPVRRGAGKRTVAAFRLLMRQSWQPLPAFALQAARLYRSGTVLTSNQPSPAQLFRQSAGLCRINKGKSGQDGFGWAPSPRASIGTVYSAHLILSCAWAATTWVNVAALSALARRE